MDIERNLTYNENTVRSGDFPEDLKNPERETMQRKIMVILLTALLLLGGCSRKEELLIMTGEQTGMVMEAENTEGVSDAETESAIETESATETASDEAGQETAAGEKICIHVCGAVKQPGVYELQAGDRVYEAVEQAGGFTQEADQNYVNQAQTLQDGMKLYIPTVEESAELGGSMTETENAGQAVSDGRVNINTASESELCSIPGIGTTRAKAIVAYREQHGAFQTAEDIMKVSGIKEGTYEKIRDSITVKH